MSSARDTHRSINRDSRATRSLLPPKLNVLRVRNGHGMRQTPPDRHFSKQVVRAAMTGNVWLLEVLDDLRDRDPQSIKFLGREGLRIVQGVSDEPRHSFVSRVPVDVRVPVGLIRQFPGASDQFTLDRYGLPRTRHELAPESGLLLPPLEFAHG